MNRDERDGKAENVKGRVKEAAGIVSGDEELEKKGAGGARRGRSAPQRRRGAPEGRRGDRGLRQEGPPLERRRLRFFADERPAFGAVG